jgi:hypothetical protein
MAEISPPTEQTTESVQETKDEQAAKTGAATTHDEQPNETAHVTEKRGHEAVTGDDETESRGTGAAGGESDDMAAKSNTEFPPKRPKRDWLAFHGVKHTRVGAAYQVSALPAVDPEAANSRSSEQQ